MSMDTYDETKISVLNLDPPIFTAEEFISEQECDNLVLAAKTSGGLKSRHRRRRATRTFARVDGGVELARVGKSRDKKHFNDAEKLPDIRGLTKRTRFRHRRVGRASGRSSCHKSRIIAAANILRNTKTRFRLASPRRKGIREERPSWCI